VNVFIDDNGICDRKVASRGKLNLMPLNRNWRSTSWGYSGAVPASEAPNEVPKKSSPMRRPFSFTSSPESEQVCPLTHNVECEQPEPKEDVHCLAGVTAERTKQRVQFLLDDRHAIVDILLKESVA